jgi:hypothetical protein
MQVPQGTIDNCLKGGLCGRVGQEETGSCKRKRICNSPEQCEEERTCLGFGREDIGVCISSFCDPFTNESCQDDQICYVLQPNPVFSICAPAGTAQEGETCSGDNMCALGLGCYNLTGSGENPEFKCYKYCDENHACGEGQTCDMRGLVLEEEAPDGKIGLCK